MGTTADGSTVVSLLLSGVVVVDEIGVIMSSLLVAEDNLLEETQRKSWMAMLANFIVLGCC
jgi:hypothetical protein